MQGGSKWTDAQSVQALSTLAHARKAVGAVVDPLPVGHRVVVHAVARIAAHIWQAVEVAHAAGTGGVQEDVALEQAWVAAEARIALPVVRAVPAVVLAIALVVVAGTVQAVLVKRAGLTWKGRVKSTRGSRTRDVLQDKLGRAVGILQVLAWR